MNARFVFVLLSLLLAAPAWPQSYPVKPVRLIIPFPPGGSTDLLGRRISQELEKAWGQQIVIDNRPGAGGTIGVELASRAAPDGYTLVLGHIGTFGVGPSLYSKLPYDPVRDFAPIVLFSGVMNMAVVHPSLPVRTIKELIALARSKAGQLNYGSAGNGSASHLQVEYFKMLTRTDIVHVPYKGTGPMVTDLVSGQTQLTITGLPGLLGQVKAGRLRPLAVATTERVPLFPDVPTMIQAGVPGYVVTTWYGPLAPAKTPRDVVMRINQELMKSLQTRDLRNWLASNGVQPFGSTPEEYAAHIKSEMERWAKVVKAAEIQPQ